MTGLILEGGAFRGLYTDGVLDALLDLAIHFDYIIGVSAGIANAYSYASEQKGRNLEIILKYVRDKRYFGLTNLFKCRSIFGLNFVYGDIPNCYVPFDHEALGAFRGRLIAGVTNADTGKAEYYDADPLDKDFMLLRATCAIPAFFPVISYRGKRYFDGGLADPIPIQKALADGCQKCLVVLTQPRGYVKTPSRFSPKLVGTSFKNLKVVLTNRHQIYNDAVKYCEALETKKQALILRPDHAVAVSRFERSLDKLQALYDAGYRDTLAHADKICALFDDGGKKQQPQSFII